MRKSRFFRWLMTAGMVAGVIGSMLPGATPASAADRAWSSQTFPGSTSTTGIAVGTASNVRDNANVVAMAWASDGQTGYAIVDRDDGDTTAERIAKTTNGGRTWTYVATTTAAPGDGTLVLRAIATTPDGQTVVVAQSGGTVATTKIWRSTNAASTFGQLGGTFGSASEIITSIALSPDYANDGIVLVGVADPDNAEVAVNGVFAWNIYGASFWRAAAGTSTTENVLNKDVVAVAFSPTYASDKAIFALSAAGRASAEGIAVNWAYQDSNWNDAIGGVAGPKVIVAGSATLGADFLGADPADSGSATIAEHVVLGGSLALPSDFSLFNSSRRIMFVGLNTTQEAATGAGPAAPAEAGGVYRTKTGSAEATERLGSVATAAFDVHSVSLTGSNATPGTLFVGMVGGTDNDTVRRTTRQYGTVTDLNWAADGVSSDPALGPTGAGANVIASTIVMAAPDFATSNKVYAANNSGTAAGTNEGTAFSISEDGGANWHGLSLIDNAVTVISDIAASGNTVYVATTGTGNDSLWRSTDAGSNWRRVDAAAGAPLLIAMSPNYATDGVVYLVNGGVANAQVRKSVNSGAAFTAESAPGIGAETATAAVAIDTNTLLVGGSGATLRRSISQALTWATPTVPTTGVAPATRISDFASMGAVVLLGDAAGNVFRSTDSGSNWARVGTSNVGAASDTAVVFDPSYATTGLFYAIQDGTIDRWGNHVTAWSTTAGASVTRIDTTANTVVGNPVVTGYSNNRTVVSSTGVLYTGDSTVPADTAGALSDGVRRSNNPQARIGAAVDFATVPAFTQNNVGLAADATSLDGTTADVLDGPMVMSGTKLYAVRSSGTDAIRQFTDTAEYTGAMALTSPVNDASAGTVTSGATTISAGTITLRWPAVTGATAFEVQLDNDSDFSSTIDIDTVAGADLVAVPVGSSATSFSIDVAATTLQANTKYYWRARAFIDDVDPQTTTSADVLGKWSAPASFVAGAQAGAGSGVPTLTLPVLGATGYTDQSAQPTFVWTAVNNATNYEIQVSTDGTFSDATKIAIDKTGANRLGNQLAYQDTTVSLAPNMTYFWRVRAYISSSGISSAWSPASAFRTTSTTSSTTAVSPTVALAAAEATGKLEVVTAFDYSTGTYQAYVPGLPGNKLTTISPNSVIFVTLKQNATVKVSGVSFEVKANTPTPLPVGSTVSIEVTLK